MGGDFAPKNVISGSLDALRETGNRFEVLLVGPEQAIRAELETLDHAGLSFQIVNATEVIGMHDAATAGLKQKKDSSIAVGIAAHRDRRAEAFVSAGHSGAVMSSATLILGRIKGVGRPTIGTFLPSEKGPCLVLDAGANVDCKPQHLFEFAVMGSIFSSMMLKIDSPSVGLLSIGEERSKGNDLTLETYKLLAQSSLNFIGNVEGRDILTGKAQVVVCDGFVGNIVLKLSESFLDLLKTRLRAYASSSIRKKIWTGMMYGTLRRMLKDFDYQEAGGVPLLGVNGVVIIGHGKSTAKAVKNMIFRAEEMTRIDINGHIQQALSRTK